MKNDVEYYSSGALTSTDNVFFAILNSQINAALEGTGFGTFTFEPYGNISNRQAALSFKSGFNIMRL